MNILEYHHKLPASRLGTHHANLLSYKDAISRSDKGDLPPTEYSLVVVLSPNHPEGKHGDSNLSIMLGKKLRGFGEGFYNSMGGKIEKNESSAEGARRELEEESGIKVSLSNMEESFVGIINFTFEDSDANKSMRVYLYCVFVSLSNDDYEQSTYQFAQPISNVDPNDIRGCDEIEPRWFHNIHNMPLNTMFADDSVWLTMLLTNYNNNCKEKLMFDAWFHFYPGGTETNTIMHHYIQINEVDDKCVMDGNGKAPEKMTLEKRLFHELHANHIHSPSIKEFKENWAFANAVRSNFGKEEERMEFILDVAGGHGALGALFLLLVPGCHTATIIDPAKCNSGKRGVNEAWSRFWSYEPVKKELRYRHECLRTGLRKELDQIMQTKEVKSTNVTVVACHACQHLTDETLQIASEYGVNVAVMPCCQKDNDGWWKSLTKRLVGKNASLSIGTIMDILAAGKMMAWETGLGAGVRYEVKMKLISESISLQNRMILCQAIARDDTDGLSGKGKKKRALAHEKLTRAYHRAHQLPKQHKAADRWCSSSLLAGFCMGAAMSFIIASQLRKN